VSVHKKKALRTKINHQHNKIEITYNQLDHEFTLKSYLIKPNPNTSEFSYP